MPDEVFTWDPRANNPQGDVTQRVLSAGFGDGYSQRVEDGINTRTESWPLSFTGRRAYMDPIKAFLDRHGGARSFLWTPPFGEQGRYLATGYKLIPHNPRLYTINVTFQQVHHP